VSSVVDEATYRIGEVAERLGVTTRTIRYYEEVGLFGSSPARPKGGHRTYAEGDVTRLAELIRMRDLLGLTLEELALLAEAEGARAALRDRWSGTESDAERIRIVEEAMTHVRRQLDLVRARQQRLDEFAGQLTEKLDSLAARRRELSRRAS